MNTLIYFILKRVLRMKCYVIKTEDGSVTSAWSYGPMFSDQVLYVREV